MERGTALSGPPPLKLVDVTAFVRTTLSKPHALDRRKLTGQLLLHQNAVRQLLLDASSGRPTGPPVEDALRGVGLSDRAKQIVHRVPRANADLSYVAAMDAILSIASQSALTERMDERFASRPTTATRGPSVGPLTSTVRDGCGPDAIARFAQDMRWLCALLRVLGATVFRQVDIQRRLHRDHDTGHDAACFCLTPDGRRVMEDTLQAPDIATAARRGMGPLLWKHDALRLAVARIVPQALTAWWQEDVAGVRGMHSIRELFLHVYQPLGEGNAFVAMLVEHVRRIVKLLSPEASVSGPTNNVENAVFAERKVSVVEKALGSTLWWAPPRLVAGIRQAVVDVLLDPLRPSFSTAILDGILSGNVYCLCAIASLERFRSGAADPPASPDGGALDAKVSPWLQDQLRGALSVSLRRTVAAAFGVEPTQLMAAGWSDSILQGAGRPIAEVSGLLVRCLGDLSEWLSRQQTVLSYVVDASDGASSKAAATHSARTHALVDTLILTAGKRLLGSAGHLVAMMLHTSLASKDASCATHVVESMCTWLSERDAFLAAMSHCLEVRLLDAMPLNPDVVERETTIINTIKRHVHRCGIDVRKMEGMLADAMQQQAIAESIRLRTSMLQSLHDVINPKFDVNLCILRLNMWGTVNCMPLIRTLPPEIGLAMRVVEYGYRQKWPAKKLSWAHASSRCTMDVLYANGGRQSGGAAGVELVVPLVAASILSVFDILRSDVVSREEMEELVVAAAPDDAHAEPVLGGGSAAAGDRRDAARHMFAMAADRLVALRVLTACVSPDTTAGGVQKASLRINRSFTSKARKLTAVPKTRVAALADGAAASRSAMDESLRTKRRLALKAAVVRIMKSRRVLAHNELFDLTVKHLDAEFLPTTQRFKEVVSDLLETEYIARQEGAPSSYVYLA